MSRMRCPEGAIDGSGVRTTDWDGESGLGPVARNELHLINLKPHDCVADAFYGAEGDHAAGAVGCAQG